MSVKGIEISYSLIIFLVLLLIFFVIVVIWHQHGFIKVNEFMNNSTCGLINKTSGIEAGCG